MSSENRERTLERDCEVVLIPSGDTLTLPQGSTIYVSQTLGGSYTVMTGHGLARIDGKDADALGEVSETAGAPEETNDGAPYSGPVDQEQVWNQLKNCYDPEIPVNIVDLGLIYSLDVTPREEDEGYRVDIKMTLTAPGCGMGPAIAADAKSKVLQVAGVREAEVELVWDPPWNQEMISEEGKMKLGLI